MYYTKALIKGYSEDKTKTLVSLKLNCFISEDDLDEMLETFRSSLNAIGEPLHFKITLESEDV